MRIGNPLRSSGQVLNLHAVTQGTRVNGPGTRFAIWFQGCTLRCPGCFNPDTHSHQDRFLVHTDLLVRQVVTIQREIEGVTVSGGEPLQQAIGLIRLLTGIRDSTRLSIILFSGHSMESIAKMPHGKTVLDCLDVLIAGPYIQDMHFGSGLLGSSNQQIHFLTQRYGREDFNRIPPCEVRIQKDGRIEITGIEPPIGDATHSPLMDAGKQFAVE
jgi:anaerobic ribonucleoside-triphosphate reductase activating protein